MPINCYIIDINLKSETWSWPPASYLLSWYWIVRSTKILGRNCEHLQILISSSSKPLFGSQSLFTLRVIFIWLIIFDFWEYIDSLNNFTVYSLFLFQCIVEIQLWCSKILRWNHRAPSLFLQNFHYELCIKT